MKLFSHLVFCLFFVLLINCKSEKKSGDTPKKIKPSEERLSTKTENVFIIDSVFVIKEISNIPKKIWIYLPPNYKQTKKKYPVIYMHDGQNLFDNKTSFVGEWGIDESLNKLYEETKKGFIVIGIENGGEDRIKEYTPWINEKHGGGKGDTYINFIINDLKPFIDATYRTKPEQEYTGLIGSSLGGLISYYGALQYPTIFGKIGVISPSFWFSEKVIDFTKGKAKNNTIKMYFLLGGKEGMTKDFNKISQLLLDSGFPQENLKKKINPEGKHNEAFWKSEFLEIMKFLYDL